VIGNRSSVLGDEQFVGALDRRVEDPLSQAVPVPRLIAVPAREYEVVGLAPRRGELVLAKQLDELGLQDDSSDSRCGL